MVVASVDIEEQFELVKAKGSEVRVKDNSTIEEIVTHILQHRYCCILGPRFCQKTFLLQDIKDSLSTRNRSDTISLIVDLMDLRWDTEEILNKFATLINDRLGEEGKGLHTPSHGEASTRN